MEYNIEFCYIVYNFFGIISISLKTTRSNYSHFLSSFQNNIHLVKLRYAVKVWHCFIQDHLFWLLENKKFLLHPNVCMILFHNTQIWSVSMCVFHALLHIAQRPPQSVGLLCILSMLYILENILTLKPFIYGNTSISITWAHIYLQHGVISRFFAWLLSTSNKLSFGPVMSTALLNIQLMVW